MFRITPVFTLCILFQFSSISAQPLLQFERVLADPNLILPDALVSMTWTKNHWKKQIQAKDWSASQTSCFILSAYPGKKYLLLMDWGTDNQLEQLLLSPSLFDMLFSQDRPIFLFEQCTDEALKEWNAVMKETRLLDCIKRRYNY